MLGQNDALTTRFPSLTGKVSSADECVTYLNHSIKSSSGDARQFLTACNPVGGPEAVVHVACAQLLRSYVGQEQVGFFSFIEGAQPSHFLFEFDPKTTNNDFLALASAQIASSQTASRTDSFSSTCPVLLRTRRVTTSECLGQIADPEDAHKSDILLQFNHMDTEFQLHVRWKSSLFSASHGPRILSQITHLMHFTVGNLKMPAMAVSLADMDPASLSVVNPMPVRRIRQDGGGPQLLHQLFEIQARAHPERIALQFLHSFESGACTRWTYHELNAKASCLSHHLLTFGLLPDDKVPILATMSPNSYVAILAVLKAGCAYVPLSADAPVDRVQFVAGDVDAKVVLTDAACIDKFAGMNISLINMDDPEVSNIIASAESLDVEVELEVEPTPGNLAYCMYTSGSTGVPKGVALEHRNAVESILAHQPVIPHSPPETSTDIWLHFASLTFDVSVCEIFFPLSTGMCIAATTREQLLTRLEDTINFFKATHTELTPTVASVISRKNVPTVKTLLTIGEMLTQYVVDEWARDGSLQGAYGPTEAAIHCTMAASFEPFRKPSNIGLPLDTTTLYIMTSKNLYVCDELRPLPIGFIGELFIGGDQVARGYIKRPEATAAAFFPDLKNPGRQIYATGDLARLLDDGTVEFVGRVAEDEQVKLRGQRIELGEISHVVANAHPMVTSVTTIVIATGEGDQASKLLVTFVAVRHDAAAAVAEMDTKSCGRQVLCEVEGTQVFQWDAVETACLEHAAQKLPPYMIPNALVFINDIPRNLSGKTDRKALQRVYSAHAVVTSAQNVKPDSPDEVDQTVWNDNPVLKIIRDALVKVARIPEKNIAPRSSLAQLGIDSLGAIILASKLREQGLKISVGNMLKHPTLEAIAKFTTVDGAQETQAARTILDSWKSLPPRVAEQLSVAPSDIQDVYPATPMQDGMLAMTLKTQGRRYQSGLLWRVKASNAAEVHQAWEALVASQDTLRTGFVQATGYNQPAAFLQVVWKPQVHSSWDGEFEAASEVEMKERIAEHKLAARRWGKDISIPPVRCCLIRVPDSEEFILSAVIHHGLQDGFSIPLMLDDLQGYMTGAQPSQRPSPRTFAEYYFTREPTATEAFWRESLAGLTEADFAPFPNLTGTSGTSTDNINVTKMRSVLSTTEFEECCRAMGSTPQVLIQISWAMVVSQYTGKTDTLFGTILSGRVIDVGNVDQLIGSTIQVVPCLLTVNPNDIEKMLDTMGKQNVEVLDHSWMPMRRVTELLDFKGATRALRDMFDTFVVYQKVVINSRAHDDNKFSIVDNEDLFEQVIMMEVEPVGDELILTIRCQDHRVPAEHGKILLKEFQGFLLENIYKVSGQKAGLASEQVASI